MYYWGERSEPRIGEVNANSVCMYVVIDRPVALRMRRNMLSTSLAGQTIKVRLVEPIVADLKRLEEGIPVYDAYLQQEALLVAPVMAFLCDNPRHSELLSHAGGRANKYCRMCMVCDILFHNQLCILF